jgi:hypothetical protein
MNYHAFAVDIRDLEVGQFSPTQAGCVQRHQHRAMHQVRGGLDEPSHLFLAQHRGQSPWAPGKGNLIGNIRPPQRLDEEKTQSRSMTFDGPRRELAIAKQMNLVLPDMV